MLRSLFSNFWLKFTKLFKPKPKSIKKIKEEIAEILSSAPIIETVRSTEAAKEERQESFDKFKAEGIQKAASQILEIVNELEDSFTSDSNLNNKLESLQELKIELETLEQKISLLRFKLGQEKAIQERDISYLNNQIDLLYSHCRYLELSIEGIYSIPKFDFDKKLNDFELTLDSLSLTSIFQKREKIRLDTKVAHNKLLSIKLTELEQHISRIKFDEAKKSIRELSTLIEIDDIKAKIRFGKLKTKLELKESEFLKRKSNSTYQKINDEAEEVGSKEYEAKNRELLEQKELIDLERFQIQKIQLGKKRELTKFLTLKYNWVDFKGYLDQNNINELYHFTDKANLKSIIKEGGLYSWDYCDKSQIHINYPGGNTTSRTLDKLKKLEDFVRLSLVKDHPMKYIALRDQRIHNPITLKIKPEVCYFEETQFSTRNANSGNAEIGNTLNDLKNINLEIIRVPSYLDLSNEQKPFFQAEILVKRWIPLDNIINLSDFTS